MNGLKSMDNDYIHLSLLSQFGFCTRRAALVMLENAWHDNEYTAEGTMSHERVHTQGQVKRSDTIFLYDFRVYSHVMRLSGKCDCIEATFDESGYTFPFYEGKFKLYPIEYKHGVIRNEEEYNCQLCAQAMCLEETYNCKISSGAVFYTNSHRRVEILFDDVLRSTVISMAKALHEMLDTGKVPKADFSAKCKKCSLNDFCLPEISTSAKGYNKKLRQIALGG
jgi:CRISPR-associated exonuclease Cas4